MAVATPLIAILQGSFLLSDYRINYKDAPRPITPCHGALCHGDQQSQSTERGRTLLTTADNPLRLLVVGDSLAAGVGVSGNGLPVLPESIAKALSKALDGRVVCWTCVGTPGISASQIVQDINSIPIREPRRFEQLLEELKTKRDKWKQLRHLKMERLGNEEESATKQQGIMSKFIDWWKTEEKQAIGQFSKELAESGAKWWKRKSGRIEQTYRDIQEAIHATPDGKEENPAATESGQAVDKLVRKGNLFRRDSLDPSVASTFDVAVVLLGLNDLKEAFMPHMMQGANSSLNEGMEPINGTLNTQLQKLFHALKKIMGKIENPILDQTDHTLSTEEKHKMSTEGKHRILIVVPELPVAPLEAFQLVPLCWFLLPLFRAMESNKKFLSSAFPDHVVFIDQPDLAWWSDAEERHSLYKEEEEFILRLSDIAQTAQAQVKQLMERFYYPNDQSMRRKRKVEGASGRRKMVPLSLSKSVPKDGSMRRDRSVNCKQKKKRALYIAQDKMHPNDEGYDLWGRHIAEAVVRHWGRPQV